MASRDIGGLSWLAAAADRGEVHTVRLGWADRLGGWRGKRMPVTEFLRRAPFSMGFCDGMIVCDVQCDIIEATPFSNYSTGYPDLHVHFDPGRARPAAWAPGEAFVFGVPRDAAGRELAVAPVVILTQVLRRLAGLGTQVMMTASLAGAVLNRRAGPPGSALPGSALPEPVAAADVTVTVLDGLEASGLPATGVRAGLDPGSFVLTLGPAVPTELAEALVIAKSAAKEIASQRGLDAVFMTLRPGAAEPALLTLEATVTGAPVLSPESLQALLEGVRPLLFPSVTAMKARPPEVCVDKKAGPAGACLSQRVVAAASSEADPATACAALLAAIGALAPAGTHDWPVASGGPSVIRDLRDAAVMTEQPWVTDWLGTPFLQNAVPLFQHEAELFQAAITDWEISRYWSAS
jgi:glutamine synthetase